MPAQSEYKHIMLNEAGEAFIEGHPRMKVRLLVGHGLTNGWSPEEFKWQFPQLTMAQVHAALTYHYDHQSEMDAENAVDLQQSEKGTGPRISRLELEDRRARNSA